MNHRKIDFLFCVEPVLRDIESGFWMWIPSFTYKTSFASIESEISRRIGCVQLQNKISTASLSNSIAFAIKY